MERLGYILNSEGCYHFIPYSQISNLAYRAKIGSKGSKLKISEGILNSGVKNFNSGKILNSCAQFYTCSKKNYSFFPTRRYPDLLSSLRIPIFKIELKGGLNKNGKTNTSYIK